jgi:hypothetical protein
MQKLVVFTEEEYNGLMLKFANAFIEQIDKSYGVKLLSNEGKTYSDDKYYIIGTISTIWDKAFK